MSHMLTVKLIRLDGPLAWKGLKKVRFSYSARVCWKGAEGGGGVRWASCREVYPRKGVLSRHAIHRLVSSVGIFGIPL